MNISENVELGNILCFFAVMIQFSLIIQREVH